MRGEATRPLKSLLETLGGSRSQKRVSGEVLQTISAQLLLFHSPVLKPDFDLAVGEVQHSRKLQPFLLVYVNVKEEFPLQLADLELGVWTPLLPGSWGAWTTQNTRNSINYGESKLIMEVNKSMLNI